MRFTVRIFVCNYIILLRNLVHLNVKLAFKVFVALTRDILLLFAWIWRPVQLFVHIKYEL